MWLQGVLFVLVIGSITLNSSATRSGAAVPPELQKIVELKLRTSAKLQDNLMQILSRLPMTKSYELRDAVNLVVKFLENDGGALINSLAVLPSLSYLSMDQQLNSILASMEDHSPRFLLPAISVVRNAIRGSSSSIDLDEVFRADDGALKRDLFEGIHVRDLPKVALSTIFPKDAGERPVEGPWSGFLGEVAFLLSTGVLRPSGTLIGVILANLKVVTDDPEIRDSSRYLVDLLEADHELLGNFIPVPNPYELVRNAISSIARNDDLVADAAETLLPHLKVPESEDGRMSELEPFFPGQRFNYTLLLRSAINLDQALESFHPYEHSTRKDLNIAVVSCLRRFQAHHSAASEMAESLYGELAQKYNHRGWKSLPRSAASTRALIHGLKSDRRSPRIRRLANDVSAGLETGIATGSWSKAINRAPVRECHGPSCLVLRTLEGLREVKGIKDHALESSIIELIRILNVNENKNVSAACPDTLLDDSADKRSKVLAARTLDVDDLLQALPDLDAERTGYERLRLFLARKDLEEKIGVAIDLKKHPTRGGLLAWLLQRIQKSSMVDEELRMVAGRLADYVSYNGYGAARFRMV